jgi:hypothetical protein
MLHLPAVRVRFRRYVLLLAIAGCWPPLASAQGGTPIVPQTLTGNLTYHWEGSYNGPSGIGTESSSYTLDITLTNIQMQLDGMPNAAGEVQYVVKSAQVSVKGGGTDTYTLPAPYNCQDVRQTTFDADTSKASARAGKLEIDLPVSAGGALCGDSAILNWGEPVVENDTFLVCGCAPSQQSCHPGTVPIEWYIPRTIGASAKGTDTVTGTETVLGSAVRVQFDRAANTWSGSDSNGGTGAEWVQGSFMSADAGALDQLDLIDVDNGGATVADVSVSNGSKRGLVVKRIAEGEADDNMAPLTKILIKATPPGCKYMGKIVLDPPTVDDPKTAGIEIFTDAAGKHKMDYNGRANAWENKDLMTNPVPLWVKGKSGSDHMDDVHIKVHPVEKEPKCAFSEITFTVLEVDQPTVQSQEMSADNYTYLMNHGYNYLKATTKVDWINGALVKENPATLKLGQHDFETYKDDGSRKFGQVGFAIEGSARVHPANFDPSHFVDLPGLQLKLDRDAAGRTYFNGVENPAFRRTFNGLAQLPPGNDSGFCPQSGYPRDDSKQRDDDPTSNKAGLIYDFDIPGYTYFQVPGTVTSCIDGSELKYGNVWPQLFDDTVSFDKYFRLFGAVKLPDGPGSHQGWVRCSPIGRYEVSAAWREADQHLWYWNGVAWVQSDSKPAPPGVNTIVGGFGWKPDGWSLNTKWTEQ